MNRLKQLRTEHGLSMREVANRINVPYTTYVNYEKGVRDPSTEVLGKLAKFLKLPLTICLVLVIMYQLIILNMRN